MDTRHAQDMHKTCTLSQTLHGLHFRIIFLPQKRVNHDKLCFPTKKGKLYFHIINIHTQGRPSKCPKFYTSRTIGKQNLRQKERKNLSKFKSLQNDIFKQIYFNSTVFNIRLFKTAT